MSKDPTKNIDRYKIRGGQLNAFEFHQNQGAVSEQHNEASWAGGPAGMSDLPPDKAKAERIRQLLAEHGESVPQMNEPQTLTTPEQPMRNNNNPKADSNREEDFAPTHGRSPAVIKEMMQSRRATDLVPNPEDIIAGRPKQSQEKKEHGKISGRTAARGTTKQTAAPKSAKATKGKEVTLDKSKPGVATSKTKNKEVKQAAPRRSTKQASTTGQGKAKTQATSQSSRKQTPAGKTANQRNATKPAAKNTAQKSGSKAVSTRASAATKSAKSRPRANGKSTSGVAKPKPATTKARAKSPASKSR